MIPPTVMTISDWDRDIRPDPERFPAMLAWVASCGIDADQSHTIAITEGAVVFALDNLPARPGAIREELIYLEVVVPHAPLPPFWHSRRHALPEGACTT